MMYNMMKPASPLFSDPIFRDFFGMPQRRPHRPGMHMRIHETESAYLLESDLPGVGIENISLTTEGNVLTISAVRPAPKWAKPAEDSGDKPRREHRMERSFELEGIDAAAITADYVDGVLRLTLPKEQPEEKPVKRQIAIVGGAPALTE